MSLQILILKLLFYYCEPATEHVILAPGYPRKTYIVEVSDCDILRHHDSRIMTYHDCENYHDCHYTADIWYKQTSCCV